MLLSILALHLECAVNRRSESPSGFRHATNYFCFLTHDRSRGPQLLRAHGFVAVGPTIQAAVFRAIFTEVSARVQQQAAVLGGPMAALDEEEGRRADAVNLATVGRSWELWKKRVM